MAETNAAHAQLSQTRMGSAGSATPKGRGRRFPLPFRHWCRLNGGPRIIPQGGGCEHADKRAALGRGGPRPNDGRARHAETCADHLRATEIGGTEKTIDAHLIAWKATRSYDPRLAVLDLPGPLSTRLTGFMEGLWDAAMAETNARLEERRAYLEREREREAAGQLLDETQIRAEEAARENEALRSRQNETDAVAAGLRKEVAALRKEVAHLRRAELWDRVIREIAEILPENEWMSTEEIVRLLPPSLAKEALALDKALTPGRVNRQMYLRDHHSRFFEKKKRKRPIGSVRAGRASPR